MKIAELAARLAPFHERPATAFLALLLAADSVFFILQLVKWILVLDAPMLELEQDRGYPELFQYLKELWIVILLVAVFFRSRAGGYLLWGMLFFYLLLDDALSIHELAGQQLVAALGYVPRLGLRAQDFGELTVSFIAASVFIVPLLWSYRVGSGQYRRACVHILALLLLLVFFGIFFDMLHVAVRLGRPVNRMLEFTEDGGEMVAMSLIAGYCFLLYLRDGVITKTVDAHVRIPRSATR